ncbi:hypothetical protein ACLMJV_01090 [Sinorhizobium meliloti]|uniref:hypothetical protein n=1 Tax=Rhizobium meliloti TaxID=382 RepID=UPI00398CC286
MTVIAAEAYAALVALPAMIEKPPLRRTHGTIFQQQPLRINLVDGTGRNNGRTEGWNGSTAVGGT